MQPPHLPLLSGISVLAVLVVVLLVHSVPVAVMQVVHMITVLYGLMTATGLVPVFVIR